MNLSTLNEKLVTLENFAELAYCKDRDRDCGYLHMVKFHKERYWQKVMSLFRVHSTHSCEANKSRNFKPFLAYGRSRTLHRSHQKKIEEHKS